MNPTDRNQLLLEMLSTCLMLALAFFLAWIAIDAVIYNWQQPTGRPARNSKDWHCPAP